jgi:hypothetical protein
MRKRSEKPGELARATIAPSALVQLSLYAATYHGFMLSGWPAGLHFPLDAKSLGLVADDFQLTQSYGYRILQAFCVGTLRQEDRILLAFHQVKWGKSYFLSIDWDALLSFYSRKRFH